MSALSAVFGAAVRTRNALYDRGWLPARRLQGAVVSVGNLSVGGSGKTPFVMLLGELLAKRGIAYDILSRGYGRATRGVRFVEPNGSPRDFGDEPLLMARKLGVPVIVGEDRYTAGLAAEKRDGPRLHILDDGFQHRSLARDFDIVLITPDDARDRLLPAGRLREPLASLARADAAVLTAGASTEGFPLAGKMVWRARRGITLEEVPPQPLAFCGIARPKSFFTQLRTAGVEPAGEAVFRDHYPYAETDVRELQELREKSGAGGFVTTEKDMVNLGPLASALEPLAVAKVRMELQDANTVVDAMLAAIARRRSGAA